MNIYLVQHGAAKPKEEDPERGLSAAGERDALRVGKALCGRIPEPLEIWHSGKKRAEETAGILAIALGITSTVRKHDFLSPGDDAEELLKELESREESIMIVGHLPHLPKLLCALLGLPWDTCPVAFRNAGAICLAKGDEGYKIDWVLSPELLG